MCGISGFILRDSTLKVDRDALMTTLLDEIESRGTHATGYVAVGDDGTLEWQKAACKASVFNANRRRVPDDARVALGHTRWATQGLPAFMENNHPIRRGPFYIIHNGHVSNDTKLFETSERFPFGEVDSEAIAARLSSLGDLKFLGDVMSEIDGDAAVAAIDERDGSRLALARGNSSPLWIYNGRRIVIFASTKMAVEKAHEKHIGRIGKERLFQAEEGQMFCWKGQSEYWTQKFELIPRYTIVRWNGGFRTKWDWEDDKTSETSVYQSTFRKGKVWDSTQAKYVWPSELTGSEDKLERAADEIIAGSLGRELDESDRHSLYSYDYLNCDGCDQTVPYTETEFVYDGKETLHFCDSCYDIINEQAEFNLVNAESEDATPEEKSEYQEGIEELLARYQGEKVGDDEYDFAGYDDYAGANQAILKATDDAEPRKKSMIDRLSGGHFFRGF